MTVEQGMLKQQLCRTSKQHSWIFAAFRQSAVRGER
jgi:hypothetical protein